MTDTDENLFVAAKLREQNRGDLETGDTGHGHIGLIPDESLRSSMSFVESVFAGGVGDRDARNETSFADTELGKACMDTFVTDTGTDAVTSADATTMAHMTGVTEKELSGSSLRLPLQLDDRMTNNDATAFIAGVGNPNTGKTNLTALLAELRKTQRDDLLVISNSRTWGFTDIHVASAHDLALVLLENRDVPKFVFVDEGSTHFDARTQSREVAVQFNPLAKRFAKVGVDVFATVGHTGKDLHPELKRLVTTAFYKHTKKEVEFFADWPADSDAPDDRLFGGVVDELEPAKAEPDPDDSAPWRWNLRADLFADDLEWPELLEQLKELGPKQ